MSPPNIVFQQQNLPSSFSRQNPETVGSLVVVVGAIAEPSKKKRGRSRKIIADGNTGITGATLENPSKKVRGETSGSTKKQQEPKVLGSAGLESTMRTIYVNTGEQGPLAVCVLSAIENVRKVTLRWSVMDSDIVTYDVCSMVAYNFNATFDRIDDNLKDMKWHFEIIRQLLPKLFPQNLIVQTHCDENFLKKVSTQACEGLSHLGKDEHTHERQGEDYELWDRITDGPTILMKMVDGEQVKKIRSEFTPDDLLALKKNAKTKKILVYELGPSEYNRVSTCTTAKQIWDALVNAHEGTSQANKDLKGMTLDELVGNLRTYEMKIDRTKKQAAPEKILALKASDSDKEFELDKEQVAFITKNFSKFFKKKKGTYTKKLSTDNPNDKDEVDETAFIAFRDSDLDEEDEGSEVSILELKEKLQLFSKPKLVSLMSALIDDFQELCSDRDELFNSFASLKFDLIDLKAYSGIVNKENSTLKKQVTELKISNNNLKSEVLKLTLTGTGKRTMSKE
ncbi:hypothetical protein FXO37_03731 [Capsicum annuum]|nr:hypothetical protein FXO37_03731 [Capsicum annuum]